MKFVIVAIAIALAGSAIHPFGPVKTANAPMDGPPMDAESAAIIARACANCHTERVTWPWYGYVAPVSWLLEKDVSEARSHMNTMTMRQNNWTLGTNCVSYCRVVTTHHTIGDMAVLPS